MRALLFFAVLSSAAAAGADEIDELAKAVDRSPDDPKAYDAFAMAAFKAKRFDDAIRKLKVGVARIPEYSEGYYKLAYAYRQKKEWADAADYYRRYTTLNPSRTDTFFGLGASLQGLGDTRGAIAAYDKYISLEKDPAKQRFVDSARAELAKLDPARAPKPGPTFGVIMPAPVDPYRAAPPPAGPPRSDAPALRAQAEDLQR
jgi:tetratricopeptide (TPR) repeat protein